MRFSCILVIVFILFLGSVVSEPGSPQTGGHVKTVVALVHKVFENILHTAVKGLQVVMDQLEAWRECVDTHRTKGLPLAASVDTVQVLVKCVGLTRHPSCIHSSKGLPLVLQEEYRVVPSKLVDPRKRKPALASTFVRRSDRPPRAPKVSSLKPCEAAILIETGILSFKEFSTANLSSGQTATLSDVWLLVFAGLFAVLMTVFVSGIYYLVVKNTKTSTIVELQRLESATILIQSLWRKKRALYAAATSVQSAWRRQQAEAELSEIKRATTAIQTFWRRKQAELLAERKGLQDMTKENRNLSRKIAQLQKNLREVQVSDDGNCLFYSLSVQMWGDTTHHEDMRGMTVDWLNENGDYEMGGEIQLVLTEDAPWNEFITKMRRNKEYGTLACLYAASEVFAAVIHVVNSSSDNLVIYPHTCLRMQEFWLTFSGKHYNPLLSSDTDKKSVPIPEVMPRDMHECTYCTRWHDVELIRCPRCDTTMLSAGSGSR